MAPIARLAFFGTPDFAVPTLAALVNAGRRPLLVVAQPDRPAGRGRSLQKPPVARFAEHAGLALEQPESVRDPEFLARLEALALDVAVVVAFGQIFPVRLLEAPRLGCVNVHASLLPAYRGAAPIQAAVAAGATETGVTTMRMEKGLDSGPIYLERSLAIGPEETSGELSTRLATEGASLLLETLDRLETGDLEARPQADALATYAPRLDREAGRADWSLPAARLADRLRAFTPWPGLTARLRGEPVKIVAARAAPGAATLEPAGSWLGLVDGALHVACGEGSVLAVSELQRPGRRALAAADFANGERLARGECFA
ncbi:MAG TPA: methionyl-tRNA formyltransferase [Thermoanaerobaculia bacterium]|nr:methionyl-tRNA formyltransferase [Thermoanaerobaculia bacterium]